ncbi:MAG TPA: hypothetical protein PKD37_06855 [Oligoflexia bacterium]|nr:hypothetical protein [Oligoflexia bacterium]HMP27682.1 hypothetical protein [Oligoflexia bacterium]
MQRILVVDISSSRTLIALSEVTTSTTTVLRNFSLDINLGKLLLDSGSKEENQKDQKQDSEPLPEARSNLDLAKKSILETIAKLNSDWTNSVLILPSDSFLGVNIELPFGDKHKIKKILVPEVQDSLPFEINEFVVTGRTVGSLLNGEFDVFAGLISKKLLEAALDFFREIEIHPLIAIITADSMVALADFAPNFFKPNSLFIYDNGESLQLSLNFGGSHKALKVIADSNPANQETTALSSDRARQIMPLLKLTIAAAEKRYQQEIEICYLLGNNSIFRELQQFLGRNIEYLKVDDIVKTTNSAESLPLLYLPSAFAGRFAIDTAPSVPLSDFRVGEFRYRPPLKELVTATKKIAPAACILAASCLLFFLAQLFSYKFGISKLNALTREKITSIIDDQSKPLPHGEEMNLLSAENYKLRQELGDLPSPTESSILDVMIELSKDFPTSPDYTISSLKIKDNKVEIEGFATNYAAVEEIEKKLRRRSDVYKRFKRGDSSEYSATPGSRPFSFNIWLRE